MDGLRKIKDDQWVHLEKIGEIKDYPGKLRELFEALKTLRTEQKQVEESIREILTEKKGNFENIIRLEDELKDFKKIRK